VLTIGRLGHGSAAADYCGNSGPACQTASAGYAATVLAIAASYGTTSSGSPAAQQALQVALTQVGTPYLWGGESTSGFDCSGLVQYSYARAGITLPRTAQQQYTATTHLPDAADLEPGDLVFFGTGPGGVEHVGIALGDGRMIDAPHTGAFVRVEPDDVDAPDFVGATRPTAST
jgi:cell wall-associated NlpC family hydrolase